MLGEVRDEKVKITKFFDQHKVLHDRMEEDYGLLRLEPFRIPVEEGEWEEYTTNTPAVLGNSIQNFMASGWVKLWISAAREIKKEKRKAISATEQLALGALWMADRLKEGLPEGLSIQEALSFYAPIRGWVAVRLFLREEEDGKGRRLIPDVSIWDPINVFWLSGTRGLLWGGYRRYASKVQLEDEYEGSIKAEEDGSGQLVAYDVWDEEEEGTFIGEEWIKKEKHGVDYVPIYIHPCGARPLVQSGRYTDTLKDWGESVFVNDRHLFQIESRLQSYNLTRAGQAAKMPKVIYYNSEKDARPPEIMGDPYVKNRVIPLDRGKGQEIAEWGGFPSNENIMQMLVGVQRQINMGGITPIALGQLDQALPAAGIDMLQKAAMNTVLASKRGIEAAYVWMAKEIVGQYKNGGFGKVDLEGYNNKKERFEVEVKPGDIKDNMHFEAELVLDVLRDEVQKTGILIQLVRAGIISKQTGRDKYGVVEDTDLEAEIIAREQAEEVGQIKLWEMAKALWDDGNKMGAQIILNQLMQMARPQAPAEGAAFMPPSPQAQVAAQQQAPMTEAQRLGNMGLVGR